MDQRKSNEQEESENSSKFQDITRNHNDQMIEIGVQWFNEWKIVGTWLRLQAHFIAQTKPMGENAGFLWFFHCS